VSDQLPPEPPGELIKARSIDALRRTGMPPPPGNLLIYSRDTEDDFAKQFPTLGMLPPLNTEAGHNFVLALIDALGGVDVVDLRQRTSCRSSPAGGPFWTPIGGPFCVPIDTDRSPDPSIRTLARRCDSGPSSRW
jgi:hypothetical protein